MKYHINNNGEVKICQARKRACRFGGASGNDAHFESRSDAENFLQQQYGKSKSVTKASVAAKKAHAKKVFDKMKTDGVRVKNVNSVYNHNFAYGKNTEVSNVDVLSEKLPSSFLDDLRSGKIKGF